MKTSNKLIISALILVVVCLFGYDYLLKQEYLSGNYKNPYRDFVKLKYRDFDSVDVTSSTAINVKVVQGLYKVMADTNILSNLVISQTGRRLKISGVFKQSQNYNLNPYIVFISCPRLKALYAGAIFTVEKKSHIDTASKDEWNMRNNLVEGFNQDSLTVEQDYGSAVVLSKNHLQVLTVTTGLSNESGSKTSILRNNDMRQASFDIRNRSRLLLDGKTIQNLKYQLADSAQLVITGSVPNTLTNAKPYHK